MTRMTSRLLLVVLLFSTGIAVGQRAPIQQQLTFAPYHSNGIYNVGETVGWSVMPGPATPSYERANSVEKSDRTSSRREVIRVIT